jgi:dTDP-4-amino-4,6-dideoxygalactose transaminase
MVDLGAQLDALRPGVQDAIGRVLEHGQFVLGPEVAELEQALGARTNSSVVTCASGTDALVLALRALGTQPHDRVVVPAFTFAATAGAVALIGAEPMCADVSPADFNLDPDLLASQLAGVEGPPPVGIIAVDLFGQPADHERLASVATDHGCWLLVDAAQSFGASRAGRPAGGAGVMATTSFFPSKPLGCYGDGGAVFCQDADDADVVRSLRNHGAGRDRYENVRVGTNSRLDTIQAAVLLQKLSVFDDELGQRSEIARRYGEALGPVVTTPQLQPDATSTWAQYTIRSPARDEIVAALADRQLGHAIHYRATVADQPAYRAFTSLGDLEVARRLCTEVVSLPMHPYLTTADQDAVIEAVLSAEGGRP